jgi:hypothetical protein
MDIYAFGNQPLPKIVWKIRPGIDVPGIAVGEKIESQVARQSSTRLNEHIENERRIFINGAFVPCTFGASFSAGFVRTWDPVVLERDDMLACQVDLTEAAGLDRSADFLITLWFREVSERRVTVKIRPDKKVVVGRSRIGTKCVLEILCRIRKAFRRNCYHRVITLRFVVEPAREAVSHTTK